MTSDLADGFGVEPERDAETGRMLLRAIDGDGLLKNTFEVDTFSNFILDASGDSREYFVIINRSEVVDLRYLNIELRNGVDTSRILYVFPNAQRIYAGNSGTSNSSGSPTGLGFPGTILAPYADMIFVDGLITGSVYVQNLYGAKKVTGRTLPGGQIDYSPFVCFDGHPCRDLFNDRHYDK